MSYEAFRDAFLDEICRQAEGKYQISLQKIQKNNGISKDAVSISCEGNGAAPVIYIDSFYENYQKGGSVARLAAAFLKNFEEIGDRLEGIDTDFFSDYAKVCRHIYCRLVNTGWNRESLREIPFRTYLDLAVVYYYMTETEMQGQATVVINRKHLETWGITEEELDAQAWKNTVSDLAPQFCSMREILRECLGTPQEDWQRECMPAQNDQPGADGIKKRQETDDLQEEEYRLMQMYVLTNQKKVFGAICIRYPELLAQIAERLEGDFYILPSSVHECILVPADERVSKDMLKEMVTDINHTQVEPQEMLADQVYLYSRALGKIVF